MQRSGPACCCVQTARTGTHNIPPTRAQRSRRARGGGSGAAVSPAQRNQPGEVNNGGLWWLKYLLLTAGIFYVTFVEYQAIICSVQEIE